MEVRTIIDEDGNVRKHYIADPGEHVLLPGPVSGIMTLADGTAVNVTPEVIVVDGPEQASELNDLIGQHWLATGHPDDVDVLTDPETGKETPVQRPFVFVDDTGKTHVGVGVPHGDHELDEANGITNADADPRVLSTKEG